MREKDDFKVHMVQENAKFSTLCASIIIFPTRGITGKFIWVGKVIFPDFFPSVKCSFPLENFHFGRTKTNFSHFEKWKAKKKKKKKKKISFCNSSSFHFKFFTFSFSIFLLFTPFFFFFLAYLLPIGQQKFPGR